MKLPIVNIREIILWGACLFLAFFLIRGCDTPIDKDKYIPKELFDASQDTLHKFRNSFGQEETKTKLLYGTISDLKKLGSSKDSSIQKLLALVNKKTISATVLSTATSSTVTTSTAVSAKDTIRKDSLVYIYPEYKFNKGDTLKNKWEEIYATANKDSFHIKYKIFNEFDITQRYEKQGVKGKLFKQKIAMVNVINKNPKTETRELKSFAVAPPKQKKGIVFVAGVLVGIIVKQKLLK